MKTKNELNKNKTIFLLTSKYMSLIQNENSAFPSLRAMMTGKIIRKQTITEKLMKDTFNKSNNQMLAFNTLEDAQSAMTVGLKGNNTTPSFIEGFIPFFAVPVLFKAEIPDNAIPDTDELLSAETSFNYFETNTIPYHISETEYIKTLENGSYKNSVIAREINLYDGRIKQLPSCPKVFTLDKEKLGSNLKLIEGTYLDTSAEHGSKFKSIPINNADYCTFFKRHEIPTLTELKDLFSNRM